MIRPTHTFHYVDGKTTGTTGVWMETRAFVGEIQTVKVNGFRRYVIPGEPRIYLTEHDAAEELRERYGPHI